MNGQAPELISCKKLSSSDHNIQIIFYSADTNWKTPCKSLHFGYYDNEQSADTALCQADLCCFVTVGLQISSLALSLDIWIQHVYFLRTLQCRKKKLFG